MSQAGYTPIQLYYSTTAAAAPSAGNLANGELAVNITDGKLFYKDNGGVVRVLATAAGSAGDVVGPGSSTDNALVRFDGTTGKLVQSSVGILSDAGALSGLTSVAATTFTGALTGNASTATTLQTSRTIWGQSFDGSANVTGALTGVTDLTASGSLTLSAGTANGVAYLNGSKVLTTGSALTFDGTNLGVGIASPSAPLSFANATGQKIRFYNALSGYGIGVENSEFRFVTDNSAVFTWGIGTYASPSEQMRLTSTGLGIGTSSPGYKLTVAGTGGSATVSLLETGVRSWGIRAGGAASGTFDISDFTAGLTRLTLDSSGNLGVGVTPQARLNVQYADSAPTASGTISSGVVFQYAAGGVALNMGSSSGGYVYFNSAFANNAAVGQAYRFYQGATQAMTLDASGNLSVGTTSALAKLTVEHAIALGGGGASKPGGLSYGMYLLNGVGPVIHSEASIAFAAGGTERARIDSSGNLLVGTTSTNPTNGHVFNQNGGNGAYIQIGHPTGTGSGVAYSRFMFNQTEIGSITQSGTTAVLYNITSDQRLKENIQDAEPASALIDALQVREYNWKSDGSHQRYGFIAQELVTVAPEAVHQPANPEAMMAVDYSKLVPMLVKEIQSLRQRLAAAGI